MIQLKHRSLATIGTMIMALLLEQGSCPQTSGEKSRQPVLVELFTSEGCSSCPPADALLKAWNGSHTADGRLIVALSEHVTYWNRLGWSDPNSQATFDARQNAYAERFRLDGVYTPQVVVNGTEQMVGSSKTEILRALQRPTADTGVSVHILAAVQKQGVLRLSFSSSATVSGDIFAAVTDDVFQTDVKRGENAGRTLTHVAVARALVRVAPLSSNTRADVELALPGNFKATGSHHVVLFAQAKGAGRVLSVDTTRLEPTDVQP